MKRQLYTTQELYEYINPMKDAIAKSVNPGQVIDLNHAILSAPAAVLPNLRRVDFFNCFFSEQKFKNSDTVWFNKCTFEHCTFEDGEKLIFNNCQFLSNENYIMEPEYPNKFKNIESLHIEDCRFCYTEFSGIKAALIGSSYLLETVFDNIINFQIVNGTNLNRVFFHGQIMNCKLHLIGRNISIVNPELIVNSDIIGERLLPQGDLNCWGVADISDCDYFNGTDDGLVLLDLKITADARRKSTFFGRHFAEFAQITRIRNADMQDIATITTNGETVYEAGLIINDFKISSLDFNLLSYPENNTGIEFYLTEEQAVAKIPLTEARQQQNYSRWLNEPKDETVETYNPGIINPAD